MSTFLTGFISGIISLIVVQIILCWLIYKSMTDQMSEEEAKRRRMLSDYGERGIPGVDPDLPPSDKKLKI